MISFFIISSPFLGVEGGIYYHVMPQNVLIFFQKIINGFVFQNLHFWHILCSFLLKIEPKSHSFIKKCRLFNGRYHMVSTKCYKWIRLGYRQA